MTVVWLKEVDQNTPNACWIPSNKVDPDAVPFAALDDCAAIADAARQDPKDKAVWLVAFDIANSIRQMKFSK